jgi:hypothetical protein
MKSFNSLSELRSAPEAVYKYFEAAVLREKESGDSLNFDPEAVDFESFFGGVVYLVEEPDDLEDIDTTLEGEDGWLSLAETADAFEQCEYLEGDEFLIVYNTITDSGGNSYIIPKEIAEITSTVLDSISQSNAAKLDA